MNCIETTNMNVVCDTVAAAGDVASPSFLLLLVLLLSCGNNASVHNFSYALNEKRDNREKKGKKTFRRTES